MGRPTKPAQRGDGTCLRSHREAGRLVSCWFRAPSEPQTCSRRPARGAKRGVRRAPCRRRPARAPQKQARATQQGPSGAGRAAREVLWSSPDGFTGTSVRAEAGTAGVTLASRAPLAEPVSGGGSVAPLHLEKALRAGPNAIRKCAAASDLGRRLWAEGGGRGRGPVRPSGRSHGRPSAPPPRPAPTALGAPGRRTFRRGRRRTGCRQPVLYLRHPNPEGSPLSKTTPERPSARAEPPACPFPSPPEPRGPRGAVRFSHWPVRDPYIFKV